MYVFSAIKSSRWTADAILRISAEWWLRANALLPQYANLRNVGQNMVASSLANRFALEKYWISEELLALAFIFRADPAIELIDNMEVKRVHGEHS